MPGKSGEELLAALDTALESGELSAVSIDMSKCFDRVSPYLATQVMEKLGLPTGTCSVMRQYYHKMEVIFKNKTTAEPTWTKHK